MKVKKKNHTHKPLFLNITYSGSSNDISSLLKNWEFWKFRNANVIYIYVTYIWYIYIKHFKVIKWNEAKPVLKSAYLRISFWALQNYPFLMRSMSKALLWWLDDSGEALLGVFLLRLRLTFSKHSLVKQKVSFFGSPQTQQATGSEHPRELLPWPLCFSFDWTICIAWLSLLDSALSSGSHWRSQLQSFYKTWSHSFNISSEICSWLQRRWVQQFWHLLSMKFAPL